MAYATPADIEARLGRDLDPSEAIIVNTRLGDAELLIRARIPDLTARVTAGTISEDVVVMVEADMVLRLIKNLDGFASEQDGNYSFSIDQRVASGRLTVEDSEWALLGVRRSAFVIAPKITVPWCDGGTSTPTAPDDDTAVWG